MQNVNIKLSSLLQSLEKVDACVLLTDASYQLLWANTISEKLIGLTDNLNKPEAWERFLKADDGLLLKRLKETEFFDKREFQFVVPETKVRLRISVYAAGDCVMLFLKELAGRNTNDHFFLDENNVDILINITEHPIWLVDSKCDLMLCNTAFKKWIHGFTGREMDAGENVLDASLPDHYLNKFRMCYELALTGKNFTTVEDLFVDGALKFTTVHFNPMNDINGRITGVSCFATDITDHRKSLSRIEAQTQLLIEIANIQSHKVRGPVATLLGLVSVFNFDDYADPNNAEVVEGIAAVVEKLDVIVTEVIKSINRLSPRK